MRTARLGAAFVVAAAALMVVPAPGTGAATVTDPMVSFTYRCQLDDTPFFSESPGEITISRPDSVAPGQLFPVTFTINRGPKNGPIGTELGAVFRARLKLALTGASVATVETGVVNLTAAPAGGQTVIPPITAQIQAGPNPGSVGIGIDYLDVFGEVFGGTNHSYCRPKTLVATSVQVVAAPAPTTTTTVAPTSTTPGATSTSTSTTTSTSTSTTSTSTSTTSSTSTSTTSTTVASTTSTTVPLASTAVLREYTVDYQVQCVIMDLAPTLLTPPQPERQFNTETIPLQTVQAKVTAPDKVGVGGSFTVGVSFPTPTTNGPINLTPGNVTYSIDLSVAGGTPSPLVLRAGPNTTAIAAAAPVPIPAMAGAITASAPVGGEVAISLGALHTNVKQGLTLRTDCAPVSAPAVTGVAKVAVVAGQVTGASVTTTTVATSVAGTSGFANCAAAKAAGRGVIPRSDAAYRASLDADGDGLACEANEGARVAGNSTARGSGLASTGSSAGRPLRAGLVLLAVGVALLAVDRTRRRSAAHAD